MINASLIFPLTDERVCLGYKKTGFGAGKYNGAGGKCETGEAPEAAAVRELKEEFCITAELCDVMAHGELTFVFPENPNNNFHVHLFSLWKWVGQPCETEEMSPKWFVRS